MVDLRIKYYFSLFILCFTKETAGNAESWNLQDQCGRTLDAYGGTLYFDAAQFKRGFCQVTIVGKGAEDTMLSLFFTSFNVSNAACMENITIEEPGMAEEHKNPYGTQGLYQTFCRDTGYLNENSMYTTDRNSLILKYSSRQKLGAQDMTFTVKFTAFTSRFKGCMEEEIADDMFSCPTGRCVHTSLLCGDLNPCGDNRDCNITGGPAEKQGEDKGLDYVKFMVIIVVVVFAIFVLIQVTLIVRNEHKMCPGKSSSKGPHLEAELMPMTNGRVEHARGDVIEVQRS